MGLLFTSIAAGISILAGQMAPSPARGAAILGGGLLLGCLFTINRHKKTAIIMLIASINLILYARSSSLAFSVKSTPALELIHAQTSITGIVQIPQSTDKSTRAVIKNVQVQANGHSRQVNGSILLIAPLYSPLVYGDQVKVQGKFVPSIQEKDGGYKQYLLNHQIVGTIIYPKFKVIKTHQGNPLIDIGWQVEQEIEEKVNYVLPQDEAGLIIGIVLGVPRSLSSNLSQSLKYTGTTHIVVASGYNLSIIITLCLSFGKWLGKSKSILLALIFIGCYTLVSGANPSILRAAILAGISFMALYSGRQKDALRLLMATGLIMLIINPLWLFDTSFQLSFAATLGIMLFQKPLAQKLGWAPGWLSELVSTTTAAQLLVWPIIVYTFGTFSIISIVTNVLVLWTVPIVMACGAILIVATAIWQPLAILVSYITHPFLLYTKVMIEWCARFPFASIKLQIPWLWILVYYLAILFKLGLRKYDQALA